MMKLPEIYNFDVSKCGSRRVFARNVENEVLIGCPFYRRNVRAINCTLYLFNRSFSSDVTAAILVYQNNEMAAILVYGTGISSFLFKYFVLFHHPTGATDHVSENDLLDYLAHVSPVKVS
jgi:hypothetical protein